MYDARKYFHGNRIVFGCIKVGRNIYYIYTTSPYLGRFEGCDQHWVQFQNLGYFPSVLSSRKHLLYLGCSRTNRAQNRMTLQRQTVCVKHTFTYSNQKNEARPRNIQHIYKGVY